MQPAQPQSLAPGKCEQCRKPFDAERFALWYDFTKKKRSCPHLVCGTCRGIMCSWPRQLCPSPQCGKRFYAIQETLSPSTSSTEDFFKFVNYTESGRITKEELAVWYTTNFNMTHADALAAIDGNWQHWDVPKNKAFLGWFRAKDQGDLDKDEFKPVQEFMGESLARSAHAMTMAANPAAAAAGPPTASTEASTSPVEPRGEKRPRPEADSLTEGVLRHVAQKKQVQSEDLQRKLRNNADRGRAWFNHFDFNNSGDLSKQELITALLQTFMGSHGMTRDKISDIVNGIWDAVDVDGGGSVHFDEFQMLREALVAQLNHEKITEAAVRIVVE